MEENRVFTYIYIRIYTYVYLYIYIYIYTHIYTYIFNRTTMFFFSFLKKNSLLFKNMYDYGKGNAYFFI